MLTFDRWLAVVMPLSFKKYEKSKIVVFLTVLFPWIAGMCFEVTAPLRATSIEVNGTVICAWKTQEHSSKTIAVATLTFLGMIVIPGALMVIAYSWIIVHMKRSQSRIDAIRNNQEMVRQSIALNSLKRVTTTAFFASSIIIVCWLPDQLYYSLSQVNLTELGTTVHFVFKSLAFSNSCINPVVYCFSNRMYRGELRELLCCFWCKVHPQGGELSGPGQVVPWEAVYTWYRFFGSLLHEALRFAWRKTKRNLLLHIRSNHTKEWFSIQTSPRLPQPIRTVLSLIYSQTP